MGSKVVLILPWGPPGHVVDPPQDRSKAVKVEMQVEAWIVKGTRVRVSRLVADPRTCLAGVQMKQSCTAEDWVGTVTHVYGDHPTHPQRVWFTVLPDGADADVEVEKQHIVGVIDA